MWFSLETKVFTILALALAVLFVGLFSPSFINSWLLAARLGIAGVVAIWLVVWLLWVRRTGWSLPSPATQGATVPVAAAAGGGNRFELATDQPPGGESPPGDQESTDAEAVRDVTFTVDSPGNTAASGDASAVDQSEDMTDKPERGSDER